MFPSSLSSKSSFLTSTFLSKRFSSGGKIKSTLEIQNCAKKQYSSMGGAGRSCADTIRRSRQNVAIATQVLSPRAIGSSLKCQRGVKHFGPADDDEEGFLMARRRTAWKKLFYYGLSIVGVILIITAIIIAMGFLQTEKHKRILTRSPPLKSFQEMKPTSYIYNTTPDPTDSLEPTESQEFLPTASSSFLVSSKEKNSKEEVVIPIFEEASPPFGLYGEQREHDQYSSQENDFESHEDKIATHNEKESQGKTGALPFLNGHGPYHHHPSDHEPDEKDESETEDDVYEGDTTVTSPLPSSDNFNEDVNAVGSKEKESVNNNNKDTINNEGSEDDWKSSIVGSQPDDDNYQNEEEGADRAPLLIQEEVKVTDPHNDDDAVFSIEVPIYISNRTINAMQHHDEHEGNNGPTQLTSSEQDKNSTVNRANPEIEEDEPNKVDEVEIQDIGLDELQETIQGNDKSSSVDDTEEIAAASDQDKGNHHHQHHPQPDSNFHRAVLHTALFHLEDDNHGISKIIPEIIERHSESPLARHDEHIITPKSRRLENRIRGRNRKIKIYKNDKLMNLKATYNPIGRDEDNFDKSAKNYTSSTSEPPSDFVNIQDFVTEIKRRPIPPPPRNFPKLSKSSTPNEDEVVGTARLISPSTPSLEEILRSIFSSVPPSTLVTKNYQATDRLPDGILTPNYQPPPPNQDFGASFASSLNHIISPSGLFPAGTKSGDEPNSSQFRKRTFYSAHDHELFANPSTFPTTSPQTQNYFGHLLGQNSAIGSIGSLSATAAGASLNNYYAPIFPTITPATPSYDFTSSGTQDSPQQLTLPGVIPFDISASFIQAAYPTPPSAQYSPQTSDQLAQLGLNNFYQTPNSYLPSTYNFNINEPSNSNNNPYNSFNTGGNIGTLTTAAGQAPTYNTISQGMNLLNLISGVIPNTYFHDQVYTPTQTWPSSSSPSDFLSSATQQNQGQIPNLAFPFINFNNVPNTGSLSTLQTPDYSYSPASSSPAPITSSSGIYSESSKTEKPYQKKSSIHPTTSTIRNVYHFDPDHADGSAPSSDIALIDEDDQLPAASALTQAILTTVPAPAAYKSRKPPLTSTSEITPLLRSKLSPDPTEQKWNKEPLHNTPSEGRSFSFQILPHKNPKNPPQTGNLIDDTLRNLNPEVIHTTSLDNFVSESKSKKKSSVSLEAPKVSFYKPITTTPNAIFSSSPTNTNLKLKGISPSSKHSPTSNNIKEQQRKHNQNDKHSKLKKTNPKKSLSNNNGLKSGFFVL